MANSVHWQFQSIAEFSSWWFKSKGSILKCWLLSPRLWASFKFTDELPYQANGYLSCHVILVIVAKKAESRALSEEK